MASCNLAARVRRLPGMEAARRLCEAVPGLTCELVAPGRTGHPKLAFERAGARTIMPIASSPRTDNVASIYAEIRRRLLKAGLIRKGEA